MQKQQILIIGAPGAGKTTQAEALARKLNIIHIPCGITYKRFKNN
jgi:adenylate kinase family enzyme